MMTADAVRRELTGYRLKLLVLVDRYGVGERNAIAYEAQTCADDLTCLLDEEPLNERLAVDYLLDRYEALRTKYLS